MKKILLFAAFIASFTTSVFAGDFYVGSQIGIAKDGLNSENNFTPPLSIYSEKNNQIAGRISAGYDFNKYFAIESGYLVTTNAHVTDKGGSNETFKIKEQVADLSGVATWYMGDSFYLYGKVGVAYINVKENVTTNDRINLLYGAAIGYNIAPNVSLDVSWTRYNGSKSSSDDMVNGKYMPSMDFYALGLTYRF